MKLLIQPSKLYSDKILLSTTLCHLLFSTFLLPSATVFASNAAQPKQILILTEKNLMSLIKLNSPEMKEIETRVYQSDFNYEQLNSIYRLNLNFDLSLERDNTEAINPLGNLGSERRLTNNRTLLSLNKRFISGTLVSLDFTRLNSRSDATQTRFSQNNITFNIEQNIFPLLFQNIEATDLKSAELEITRTNMQTQIDLLETTRNALFIYWQAVALQKSIEENTAILNRYQKLVNIVRQKKSNSNSNPGEFEQALSEFETRKQLLLSDQNTLEITLQRLRTFLNLPLEQQLEIKADLSQKEMPAFFNGKIRDLKRYQTQKLRLDIATNNYASAFYKDFPTLSLFSRYTAQGVDQDQTASFNELTRDPTDRYSVGVRLNYFFDNQLVQKEKKLRYYQQELESSRFLRLEEDLKNQIQNAYNRLKAAHLNMITTQNVLKYRSEAVNQINKNFNQGRSDISFLIDSINRKILAEIDVINSAGNFSNAFLEYQGLIL